MDQIFPQAIKRRGQDYPLLWFLQVKEKPLRPWYDTEPESSSLMCLICRKDVHQREIMMRGTYNSQRHQKQPEFVSNAWNNSYDPLKTITLSVVNSKSYQISKTRKPNYLLVHPECKMGCWRLSLFYPRSNWWSLASVWTHLSVLKGPVQTNKLQVRSLIPNNHELASRLVHQRFVNEPPIIYIHCNLCLVCFSASLTTQAIWKD